MWLLPLLPWRASLLSIPEILRRVPCEQRTGCPWTPGQDLVTVLDVVWVLGESFSLTLYLALGFPFLQAKVEMLDNLLDIEVAYSLLRGGSDDSSKDPIDVNYEKLKTDIKVTGPALSEASDPLSQEQWSPNLNMRQDLLESLLKQITGVQGLTILVRFLGVSACGPLRTSEPSPVKKHLVCEAGFQVKASARWQP